MSHKYITQICDADWRTKDPCLQAQGDFISTEEVIETWQRHYYPTPAYAIIDPVDLYMWDALADSERQMIALIEARRAPGNMGHTGGMAVTA